MDLFHHIGACQVEEIVISLQVRGVAGKVLSFVIGFGQVIALEHGAHGAVQYEDAFFYGLIQQVCSCAHTKFSICIHAAGWQMGYVLAGDVTVDTVNSF